MRATLLLTLLAACAPPERAHVPLAAQAPPGFALDATAVVARQPMTLTASGLAPGAPAFFLVSPSGPGAGDCAPNGAFCLDMARPNIFLGRADADATGTATLALTVPRTVPSGSIWFQAGTMASGVGHVSNLVERVTGDADLDGFVAPADCDDTDPGAFPGGTEVCGDGVDNDCVGGDQACNTPPVFAGVDDLDPSDTTLTVTWFPATDAESPSSSLRYAVYASTTAGGQTFGTPDVVSPAGATSVSLTGLTPDDDVFVVVRALDPGGLSDTNTVEAAVRTLTLAGTWQRDVALDSPLAINAPCFGLFTADITTMSITLAGPGYTTTGTATGRSVTDNSPYGGGLSSDAVMTGGTWTSDGGLLSLSGSTGTVQNTDCDGGFFCDFACLLNGGFFNMSVGAGGQADGQVRQFDYPSPTDTSGAVGLPYDLWTDGVSTYLTVRRSAEVPSRPDQHFQQ